MNEFYDVAVIGGGPGGTTVASLLKKYMPELSVAIFEKEKFPRDHVGESQLPSVAQVLHEMGCWQKVEDHGFPVKIGATYRWGQSDELWDFNFTEPRFLEDMERPGKYEGARTRTAFQVDRAAYDKILLDHAEELGCSVFEEVMVREVVKKADDGQAIDYLRLVDKAGDEHEVTARYFIDASGNSAIIRRAMGVPVDTHTGLQNVAFWDYWENTEWAVKIGVGGTRVQVLSLGCGWCWFIPLGPTRTSIGFICPKDYYKESGKTPEELYLWAMENEPRVRELTKNATRRGEVEATKDWSYLSGYTYGTNWFLTGEAVGFADPILAGGMALTHMGSRHLAYTILELERKSHDRQWLLDNYNESIRRRIGQHIRFADYWYAANGQFTDLYEHAQKIAEDAGLKFDRDEAWRWIAGGGFSEDNPGTPALGGLDVGAVKALTSLFDNKDEIDWVVTKYNIFEIDLEGAENVELPVLENGRIEKRPCARRDGKTVPVYGLWKIMMGLLVQHRDIGTIWRALHAGLTRKHGDPYVVQQIAAQTMSVLDVLVTDGWVKASHDPRFPMLNVQAGVFQGNFVKNDDELTRRLAATEA